jgi:two-component system sensor histidine kinase CpxA
MVRLVLRIFLAYWIAAGIVTFIFFAPRRQSHYPEVSDALDAALVMNGRLLAEAYETGRCSDVQKLLATKRSTLSIAMPNGDFLCGDTGVANEMALVTEAASTSSRVNSNHALYQVIAKRITADGQAKYIVLFKNDYRSAFRLYGFTPGYPTIAISCAVTLFLAVLLAIPIRRLRSASRQIANGKLDARVGVGAWSDKIYGFHGKHDIALLVQDFNYMAGRLQALTEAQRLLLREVSHELRSPLTRLSVGLSLARNEAQDAMHEHLDRIESEARRLNALIEQILTHSYLDTIETVEFPDQISLSDLILDLLPDVEFEAAQSGCAITTAIAPGCHVRGDVSLLRAGVENVVRNAIRYVPNDGQVHVEIAPTEKEGKMHSIVRVSDNGPGIPDEELRLVLEPFYRTEKARRRQKTGFGIGLAIAQRAAHVHGGSIRIHNRPEGGLSVEMWFPFVSEAI